MIQLERKKAVRTPDQMAKVAMRGVAIDDLRKNGLPEEIKVTVEYGGIRHVLKGTPTVKLETGEIGFYCGARGRNALPFEFKDKDPLVFGMGLNVSTGLGIENHKEILKHYGLTLTETKESDDLEAGETTE